MIRSTTKRAAAAALCAALAAFGLAACQAQEPSPEPGREEAAAREPEAPEGAAAPAPEEAPVPEGTAAPADGIPTVPEEWLSGPEEFDSEEDRVRYEAGEWHADGELRNRYSFVTVRTDSGSEYVAGELLVSFPEETTDDEIEAAATEAGGAVAEYHEPSGDMRRARLVFPDDADMEAVAEAVSSELGVQAELNGVCSVMAAAL